MTDDDNSKENTNASMNDVLDQAMYMIPLSLVIAGILNVAFVKLVSAHPMMMAKASIAGIELLMVILILVLAYGATQVPV